MKALRFPRRFPRYFSLLARHIACCTLVALSPLAHADAAVPNAGASLLQAGLGLAVVVALLIGVLWLLKRLSAPRGAAAGLLRVVAGTAVGQRERVVVIEVADTWLVLGVAPGQVSTLHQLPRQATMPEEATPPAKEFAKWLKQVMERKHAS